MALTGAPGVIANINANPLGQPAQTRGSDAMFAVGSAAWGQLNTPTLVTSWKEFERKFGGKYPNGTLAPIVYEFFRNGGTRAYLIRVQGDSTNAAGTLKTTTNTVGVGFFGKHPSALVDITVNFDNGTLRVISKYLGISETYSNFVAHPTPAQQTQIADGSANLTSPDVVNAKSRLVTIDMTSISAQPLASPQIVALTGGVAALGGDAYAAWERFDDTFGPGQMVCAEFDARLITLAERYKRIYLTAGDEIGYDAAKALRENIDSSYAAIYEPGFVKIIGSNNQLETVSVLGGVAGIFARAEREVGIHKAPANFRLEGATGVEQMTDGQRQSLNEIQVNAITAINEQGIKVYGARVCKAGGQITAIHEQRVLNQIFYDLRRALQQFIFQPASSRLFREIKSTCEQYLRTLYRQGAFYSPTGAEDDAFRVICDASNNPPEDIAQHRVTVDVGVHIVGMAEMIFLNLSSVPLATDLDVLGGSN